VNGLVGDSHVKRSAVGVRVNRDRRDAHLTASARDSDGYLSAICDQQLLKHMRGRTDTSAARLGVAEARQAAHRPDDAAIG